MQRVKQVGALIPMTSYNLVTCWSDALKFGPSKQGDIINKAAHGLKLLKEHGLDLSVSFEN